jgi:anti-sigma-K factor RskA
MLESIGAYAAGELAGEEAREAERLIFSDPDGRQLAARYATMLAFLGALGEEDPEVPASVVNGAIRRAYVAAFFRQAEEFVEGLGRDYLDAFVYYLGLKSPGPAGQGAS